PDFKPNLPLSKQAMPAQPKKQPQNAGCADRIPALCRREVESLSTGVRNIEIKADFSVQYTLFRTNIG
ncbi:hypothetical protein, partial [Bifidobacterium pseudocatenulatum]|uniref:hypothetical protein n=4 Tax=Bifidobacterium pseudocatenulatum TaxID=28026 RepID=UPI0022E30699